MTIQDILSAHVTELARINKAGVDRAIQVGEAQATIISNQIALMQDPVGDLIKDLKPETPSTEPPPATPTIVPDIDVA